MPWSSEFDDPIVLPDGKKLATLRDTIQHLRIGMLGRLNRSEA
ncbi:hypothetical protein [Bradyrhizobium australiense]|nr:hypothetical protein [Bradyrhizobium australiense]